MTKEKIVIVGVGNILRRDDGIGVHMVRSLESKLPTGVEVYDGGLGGFKLLDLISGAKKAIFIDAIDMGLPPGTVKVFSPQEVTSLLGTQRYSLHNSDLLEVIKLAKALTFFEKKVSKKTFALFQVISIFLEYVKSFWPTFFQKGRPEIKIVGIQPAIVEPGLELSATLRDSIPHAVQLILEII